MLEIVNPANGEKIQIADSEFFLVFLAPIL
jgi:hypothetical protein